MSVRVVGTCSLCHGPVQVPLIWHGVYPPVPTCRRCGAQPKPEHGPIIEMQPFPRRDTLMDEAAALSASQFGLTDTQAKEMIRRGEDSDRRVWREADSQEAKRLQEAMQ